MLGSIGAFMHMSQAFGAPIALRDQAGPRG
jgi:hypothetical protein